MTWQTPDISDAIAEAGGQPRAAAAARQFGGRRQFCGRVATVRCKEDNSRVREMLATAGEGCVLVIDGGGSWACALLGGNMAQLAARNHWAGILVNGCVRDIDELAAVKVGVQALAAMPRRSDKRGRGEINVAVSFWGISFLPGEYVYADDNGVVVCPEPLT